VKTQTSKERSEIKWHFFPKSDKPTALARQIVEAFKVAHSQIDSHSHEYNSNEVLRHLTSGLEQLGFLVETGKKDNDKISVPVLFGENGQVEKSFDADAYHEGEGFVLEVEAGRGVVNNQFLKDLFQACMMHSAQYLCIAVRQQYKGLKNYETVCRFFETLYASSRITLPLKGILVIGY